MSLVDADYKFIWVDIGAKGSASYAQIWNDCELKDAIKTGTIRFPDADPLPGNDDEHTMPYFIIGDDAFALHKWLMKPFYSNFMEHDECIFNYRLSRARRRVENAFGILANRFWAQLSTLGQEPETVKVIVMVCVCLHNLLRMRYPSAQNDVVDREDANHNVIPGAWTICSFILTTGMGLSLRTYCIFGPIFSSKGLFSSKLFVKMAQQDPGSKSRGPAV